MVHEETALASSRQSRQEHDVEGEVCEHDEHEFASKLVVQLTAVIMPIGHVSNRSRKEHQPQRQPPK